MGFFLSARKKRRNTFGRSLGVKAHEQGRVCVMHESDAPTCLLEFE